MSGVSNGFFLGEGYFTYAENENFYADISVGFDR